MKSLIAFVKKEYMEQIRSGRMLILGVVFVLFGIMNPAIAKLTPWLFEMLSDSMAESGMVVTTVEIDAMTSWVQFFKNIPMGLIVFVLLQSNIFTKEYQTGTLVLALTKGLKRSNVVIAKTIILITLWTIYYWMCYAITFVYNDYFWDNSIAKNLIFSSLCWWIFGLWVIALVVFFSVVANSNSAVLAGTGAIVAGSYFVGLLPKCKDYLPTLLMDGNSLIYGLEESESYITTIVVSIIIGLLCFGFSIVLLNKKRI